MDLSNPYLGMFPTVDSAVLHVLAGATKPRTGREIARLAERSQSATQRVLDRLVEHGLVLSEEAGRAHVYRLNNEHVAAAPVAMLASLRASLFRRIGDRIDDWSLPPAHLSIFGSAARGDGSTRSDVDVFVVRPGEVDGDDEVWRDQLDGLAISIREWSGNHAGIVEVGEAELDSLRRDRPPVLAKLERDAVQIHGPSARRFLRGL